MLFALVLALGAGRLAAQNRDATQQDGGYAVLAERLPGARASLRDYTLIVAGMQFSAGPGFVVLSGTEHSGELLLDSSCAAAASGAGAAP